MIASSRGSERWRSCASLLLCSAALARSSLAEPAAKRLGKASHREKRPAASRSRKGLAACRLTKGQALPFILRAAIGTI